MSWKVSFTSKRVLSTATIVVVLGLVVVLFSPFLISCVQQPLHNAGQLEEDVEKSLPTRTSIQPSPTSSQEGLSLKRAFGYAFQVPLGSTQVSILDPTSNYEGQNEICFVHKNESLPKTHQIVIDICIKQINNRDTTTGVSWIEQKSEIATLLRNYKNSPYHEEIAWDTVKSPAGRWYVASSEISIDAPRYYAFLFDKESVLRVYTYDKDLLVTILGSSTDT